MMANIIFAARNVTSREFHIRPLYNTNIYIKLTVLYIHKKNQYSILRSYRLLYDDDDDSLFTIF